MRFFKPLQATLCTALLCLALVPALKADNWDKKTAVTFGEDIQIPGQILPAGTYVFKLLNSPADRNIVQVWNGDETQLITTVIGIRDTRPHPADHPVFELDETPSDQPQILHAWFYPGDVAGVEFVYPDYSQPMS